MKFTVFAGLLFTVGSVLAADDASGINLDQLMGQMGQPSEACTAEIAKYKDCVAGIKEPDQTTEKIKAFCTSFDENKCKDFFDDITKSESACFKAAEPNVSDLISGMGHVSAKLQYQVYCAKDDKGNSCPLSDYITNNIEKLNKAEENGNVNLEEEQLKAIADDCKNDKCNSRMIAIKESAENIQAIVSQFGEAASQMAGDSAGSFLSNNATLGMVDKFYDMYKNKKCDDITKANKSDSSSDASSLKKITYAFVTMMAISVAMLF